MKLKKDFHKLGLTDLAYFGLYKDYTDSAVKVINDQTDRGAAAEFVETTKKVNSKLKDYFVNTQHLKAVKNDKETDEKTGLMQVDYFKNDYGPLSIIGTRFKKPGPEAVGDNFKNWYFQMFIAFDDLPKLNESLENFIDDYEKCFAYAEIKDLHIIGGIVLNQVIVSREMIEEWSKERINVEPWGFNQKGKMTSYTDFLVDSVVKFKELAREAEQAKEQGFNEKKLFKTKEKGQKILDNLFNGQVSLSNINNKDDKNDEK
jgi:hypothetical protein